MVSEHPIGYSILGLNLTETTKSTKKLRPIFVLYHCLIVKKGLHQTVNWFLLDYSDVAPVADKLSHTANAKKQCACIYYNINNANGATIIYPIN